MKNKCDLCHKEIINNNKEFISINLNYHNIQSKYSGNTTWIYNLCFDCNNNLSNLLTVYFSDKFNFRNIFSKFINGYIKGYIAKNNLFNKIKNKGK